MGLVTSLLRVVPAAMGVFRAVRGATFDASVLVFVWILAASALQAQASA